ncbi:hypothetical protein [Kitasatospora purpeofusca]|uniref:hypothetical protein n=1 Tax=Kitasatospora purpeofusca TaxID=67352 RepID=UPI003650281A
MSAAGPPLSASSRSSIAAIRSGSRSATIRAVVTRDTDSAAADQFASQSSTTGGQTARLNSTERSSGPYATPACVGTCGSRAVSSATRDRSRSAQAAMAAATSGAGRWSPTASTAHIGTSSTAVVPPWRPAYAQVDSSGRSGSGWRLRPGSGIR